MDNPAEKICTLVSHPLMGKKARQSFLCYEEAYPV